MSSLCEQIKTEYEQLQALKERLVLEYEKVKNSDDLNDWSRALSSNGYFVSVGNINFSGAFLGAGDYFQERYSNVGVVSQR
ncbi:hypothetical protein HZB94_01170 [Candidatus Falkowbacteria bacterium]|nr:hypothetical protein [Candidatus Falkowbacteria bacterium]